MVTIPLRGVLPGAYRAVSPHARTTASRARAALQVAGALGGTWLRGGRRALTIIERLIVALVALAVAIPAQVWVIVIVPSLAAIYCAIEALRGYLADTRGLAEVGWTLLGALGLIVAFVVLVITAMFKVHRKRDKVSTWWSGSGRAHRE